MYLIAEIDPLLTDLIIQKLEECQASMKVSFADDIRDVCGCANDPKVRRIYTHHLRVQKCTSSTSSCDQEEQPATPAAVASTSSIEVASTLPVSGIQIVSMDKVPKLEVLEESASASPVAVSNGEEEEMPVGHWERTHEILKRRIYSRPRANETNRSTAEMLVNIEKYKRGHSQSVSETCQVCGIDVDLGRRPAVYGAIKLEHAKSHMEADKGIEILDQDVDLILLTEKCFPDNQQLVKPKRRRVTPTNSGNKLVSKPNELSPTSSSAALLEKSGIQCSHCHRLVELDSTNPLEAYKAMAEHAKEDFVDVCGKDEALQPHMLWACFPDLMTAPEKESTTEQDGVNNLLFSLVEQAISSKKQS